MPRTIPIVLNLFGGPATGKSTLAALVYAVLKTRHAPLVAELTTEFAKDLIWEGRHVALRQAYVLGEQAQRIERAIGQVDVIITDSPVLLSCVYRPAEYPSCFDEFTFWLHARYPSCNVLLRRPTSRRAFETQGRIHDETQSKRIDQQILALFARHAIPFIEADPEPMDADRIAAAVATMVSRADGCLAPMGSR
jgi:hypothetical protein